MIGIKLRDNIKNYRLAEILLSNGLVVEVTNDNNNEILLFPPLNINEDYAKKALKIILISIKEISIIESY
jgi:acetylornithine/succinyldiaminopimelate/putrescine aminotransferase